jgi:formamidopyrimidine-DNA glycosylase
MPEFPEIEALRRELDDPVRAFPIAKAGPAHIATLKTYDPPLSALEGRRFAGAERRAKNILLPTEDGDLVLHVHLMSAGSATCATGTSSRRHRPSGSPSRTGARSSSPRPVRRSAPR